MATFPSLKPVRRPWPHCLAGVLLFAWSAQGQYDPDWASHFRIGAMLGLNIKAEFKMNGDLSINHPPGVYDDGYVHPGQNVNGFTSNWGYDNASQVSGSTLTMHDTTTFTSNNGSTSAKADGAPFPGLDLAYGGNLWYWGRARIGWEFGFGFLPIGITGHESASGSVNQNIINFSTGGIPIMPPPGYQGNENPGYNIDSNPTPFGSTTITNATVKGSQKLDVMLYTFRLGPSVYWDFNQYLGLSLGAGPALGLVSGDLKFDETVTTSGGSPVRNKGQVNGTDVVYGGYVNATLMYHVVHNGDIYLGFQFMPMGKATISGDGHEGKLDLGGQMYISAGVNWPF